MNTIDAAELTYPDKPDKNGYAKRYYKRRAYYFGGHNTPESFLLFGEWKRQLMDTGAAPEVKAVRKELSQRTSSGGLEIPPAERRTNLWPWLSVLSALIVSVTMLGSVKILSSSIGPSVDGVTLTDYEMDVIRGIRTHRNTVEQLSSTRADRVVARMLELSEGGPRNGNLHGENGS